MSEKQRQDNGRAMGYSADDAARTAARGNMGRSVLLARLRLMAALILPVYLETLDYTVVATAQPHIASAFNRLGLQSYIGTVYLLSSTVFLPVFASCADVFGRYYAMQLSLLFFIVGSAISTGAANMPMLLAGRGISGIGAAGILTVVRVILADSSSLNDNNWQASILVILYAVGFCTGPVIGGALSTVSFRWIFAINLPCCVLSMILVFLLLRKTARGPLPPRLRLANFSTDSQANTNPDAGPTLKQHSFFDKMLRIDWTGAFLFCSGGILVLLGLNWAGNRGWSRVEVIVPLAVGGALVLLTLAWEYVLERKQHLLPAHSVSTDEKMDIEMRGVGVERKTLSRPFMADSLIPLTVLRSYDVLVTSFAALASGMVMLVIFYFMAIFMIIVSGKSAVQAGIQLIYFAPGMGAGTMIAIRVVRRTRQPKYAISLGGLIIPIAMGLLSMAVLDNNNDQLNGFMVMAGAGVGMTFGPLTIHARFSQPESRVAVVVALQLFFRSLGGTIGLAQCSTILNAKVRHYFENLPASTLESLGSDGGLAQLHSSSLDSLGSISQLSPELQQIVRDAFRYGVRWCFISLVPWTGLSFLFALRLSKISETPEGDVHDGEGIAIRDRTLDIGPGGVGLDSEDHDYAPRPTKNIRSDSGKATQKSLDLDETV